MAYAELEMSEYPIVRFSFMPEDPTREEFDAYLATMKRIYEQSVGQVCFVFDATNTKYLSAELRVRQGLWIKENAELIKAKQRCFVFVIPNLMVRFIFDAILLISPLPAPHVVVKTLEEGLAAARQKTDAIKMA